MTDLQGIERITLNKSGASNEEPHYIDVNRSRES